MAAAAVPPLMFKSHIFRNHLRKWKPPNNHATPTLLLRPPRTSNRLTHLPALLLSLNLNLHPLPLQIRHRYILSSPHLPPLLRPCTPPPMSSSSLASTPDPIPSKTVRVVIKGRVQGVFYRNWTIENAKELGLKGWVRNRRDGSVEALFSGSDGKVGEMEQRCRRGPREARVTDKLNIASLAADDDNEEVCSLTSDLPEDVKEGHFVVHTINGEVRRFIIELSCLTHPEFLKLLEQAQEEFGFKQEGVLTVPCRPGELRKILESMKESE